MRKKDADEKPDEGGTAGEDQPSARQVSRGSRAGAKATAKGTATPKAKGGATPSAGAKGRTSAAGDSKTEERKACSAANTLKEKYLKTTSEAAGLQHSLKQDAKYNHLASQHNVATLEKYMQDLASTMMKESAAGEVWRVMVERDHAELKKEIKTDKFMLVITEFPNLVKPQVAKLEAYVKTLKDAHSKRLQAEM